jgi:hypothetical protein
MATDGHALAHRDSQVICDSLYGELSQLIPNLRRNCTKGSCGIYQEGMTRFAYVYHSRTMSQVEVWCRGDRNTLLAKDPGLDVRGRDNSRAGWAEYFPARFRILNLNQAPVAAQFLASSCFPSSASKGRRRAP